MSTLGHCDQHGEQKMSIVCHHLIQTLYDKVPRGLFLSVDPDGDVNAYCKECDGFLARSGGEWPEDAMNYVQAKVLCLVCFGELRTLNGFEVN